jgi:seryl-tRNA synthetase
MIDLQHLLQNPDRYKEELKKRFIDILVVDAIVETYSLWKTRNQELDLLRQQKNDFNKLIITLNGEEKQTKIVQMKAVSQKIKGLEAEAKELRESLDQLVLKIPCLTWDDIPVGKSDEQNPVTGTWGNKPGFTFEPKPYWELDIYKKYVDQEAGTKVMGSRGYYLRGEIARFQKVLFDYALDQILQQGFELFYVPLMLNEKVYTGTGHLPDFDGQMYETKIDEDKSFYFIGSSEPSIMGYFMDQNVGYLDSPILATCWSSCFRKEAGSYGKDQQGILRVHQFEKIEMVAISKPEETEKVFENFAEIVTNLYQSLGLHFQSVEVCTGDLPSKHRRQIDYNAYFPSQDKFREICSNGNAADFQNRGLRINYTNNKGEKETPWGLNCTAITFRTGLAILEQNQTSEGKIRLPKVLQDRFGKEFLE